MPSTVRTLVWQTPRACTGSCTWQQLAGLLLDEPEPVVARHFEGPIGVHYSLWSALRISAARSPITTQGAMVLPVVMRGMMEPSAIRRLLIP